MLLFSFSVQNLSNFFSLERRRKKEVEGKIERKKRKKMSVFEGMYIVKKVMGYKTEKEKEKVVLLFVFSILALY